MFRVATPPQPFVTLAEAKVHARVDVGNTDDDALLTSLIAAACAHVDGPQGWLGRCIGSQTLEYVGRCWGSDRGLRLLYGPVRDIEAVTYLDASAAEQTFADEGYGLTNDLLWLRPGISWPSAGDFQDAVRVRYQAGYASAEAVPAAIRIAVLIHVAHLYLNREAAAKDALTEVPMAYETLLAPYKVWSV